MYRQKRILALVPARGGSKGLPRKNIRPLCGRPLISWTITEALKSRYLDEVIISTDDKKIAQISKKCGAKVPFLRPKNLAGDKISGIDVVIHALKWLRKRGKIFDLLMLLQPTSPLRTAEDINNSIEIFFRKSAQALVSVSEVKDHPYWANILPKNCCMKNFIRRDMVNKNRQELPIFYRVNGAIYLAYCDYLMLHKSFFNKETYAYIMPQEKSVDIDTDFDFKFAEYLLHSYK